MSAGRLRLQETQADIEIRRCLEAHQSFSVTAGAGSGKTSSLVTALKYLRGAEGARLRRDGKRIVCIAYTNRAVGVISSRVDWDEIFLVSTLHSFLWGEVKRFTPDIRRALGEKIIPSRIERQQAKDRGGRSKSDVAAREMVASLTNSLANLDAIAQFEYANANFSDYDLGRLSHDDVISASAYLIATSEPLRRIIGQKYPYVFVDEAQDTFPEVVAALNDLCSANGLPLVGYFGDPMQQIFEDRAGDFKGPPGSASITKKENYRCSPEVITLLNAFRADVQQVAAGENANVRGSVRVTLVPAETPAGPRGRYTDEQIDRACMRFEEAIASWGWDEHHNVKRLFLVRRMIARRLGFPNLHDLFTGTYASAKAQEEYEEGSHFLLKPFVDFLCPLMAADRSGDARTASAILRAHSPAFDPNGVNARRTWQEMGEMARVVTRELSVVWRTGAIRQIIGYCEAAGLCTIAPRLREHLSRRPRGEEYDADFHASEKGDWLADAFMDMPAAEIEAFAAFVGENTPYSTQHGVKGEEYENVLVVFDDTEAAWHQYSFGKALTPGTHGQPTEGQQVRSRRLAYVCFSRAEKNLRILLFTPDPIAAKRELVAVGLFEESQVTIAG